MKKVIVAGLVSALAICFFGCSKSQEPQIRKRKSEPKVTTDVEQRKQFAAQLQQLYQDGDFKKLDNIAQVITDRKERFPGGDWKLSRFYEAFIDPPSGPAPDTSDRKVIMEKAERWVAEEPESSIATLALAKSYNGYGWMLRGGDTADKVSEEALAGFHQWLRKAEATLGTVKSKSPEWYITMQTVGLGLGWDRERMNRLFEEAKQIEPLYYDVYGRQALYLQARWYGKPGEWEKFAESQSQELGGIEGEILYAEICWQMSRNFAGKEFFEQNRVSWPEIVKGFYAREERYGSSIRYMNAFCLLAGARGDRGIARWLMQRIGDRWEPDFWVEKSYFDNYKKWAFKDNLKSSR